MIDRFYQIFEQQGFGHLVTLTSIGGLRGEAMAPSYSATKAYQINYMEALRKRAFKSGGHYRSLLLIRERMLRTEVRFTSRAAAMAASS